MGLSTGSHGVFTQQWQTTLSRIPERFMSAKIRVTKPGEGERTYDPLTDTWTEPGAVVLYEGKARLQPLRSARDAKNPGDDTSIQAVRLQVPLNAIPDLAMNYEVEVLECPTNPSLVKFEYIVNEIVDGSNPIEQTFEATVNNESVRP